MIFKQTVGIRKSFSAHIISHNRTKKQCIFLKSIQNISYFWKPMAFLDRFVVRGIYYCSPSKYGKSCKICLLIKNFCMSRRNKKKTKCFCTTHGYKASFLEVTNCSGFSLLFHARERFSERLCLQKVTRTRHCYSILFCVAFLQHLCMSTVTLGSTTFLSG